MFTVIIPLYNKELSIQNTIRSVLNQSFKDFEVIIVNDGSSDESLKKAKEIIDDRLRIIDQKNEGVSSARNKGIEEAKYEWLAFIDADDIWKENHLELVMEMIKEYPQDKLFATSFEYSDKRKVVRIPRKEQFTKISDYYNDSQVEHLIWTSVLVVHHSCLKENRFPVNLALGEDMILWDKLVKKNSLVKCSKVTAIYRIDSENRSNSGKYRMDKSFLSLLDFGMMESKSEKRYYRKLILQKIKYFVVKRDWNNVLYLLKKYHFNLL